MSHPTLPSPPSKWEALKYFAGLPSYPRLVARTGATQWHAPTGMETYTVYQELRVVGTHPISSVWENDLALKLHHVLDKMNVKWTSTDVVRIGDAGEPEDRVIVWIGVVPASLSGEDGCRVAFECRNIIAEEYEIADVEVEIRESVVTHAAGPKLLTPTGNYSGNSTTDLRIPLTVTLGQPICAQSSPGVEGTAGFFIVEGENQKRLLLVTARHVVFPPGESANNLFEHRGEGQKPHNVTLFSDAALTRFHKYIHEQIRMNGFDIDYQERRIQAMEGKDSPSARRSVKTHRGS